VGDKVVITGGAGFVGSLVARKLLADGHAVTLVDDMSFGQLDNIVDASGPIAPLKVLDIRDPGFAALLEGVDTVFHFAGIAALPVCQEDPCRAFDVNTSGTAQVLEAARRAEVRRVIFSSTSAVYENSTTSPHTPDEVVAPDLVYAMTKHSAEQICRAYAADYGLDVVICRFFNVYGPHQDIHRVSPPFTSYVAKELVNGRRPNLFNQSSARRDYIHADDVAALLVAMMASTDRYAAEVFNVGTGTAHSVPELYELFRTISGTDIEPVYNDPTAYWDRYPRLFEGLPLDRERVTKEVFKESLADISSSVSTFDWAPSVSIEDGIRSVYEYALAHAVET
jgi:nucleoside-diphosphate-sugar epimerase